MVDRQRPFLRCCHMPNEGIPLYATAATSSDSVVRCRVSSAVLRGACCDGRDGVHQPGSVEREPRVAAVRGDGGCDGGGRVLVAASLLFLFPSEKRVSWPPPPSPLALAALRRAFSGRRFAKFRTGCRVEPVVPSYSIWSLLQLTFGRSFQLQCRVSSIGGDQRAPGRVTRSDPPPPPHTHTHTHTHTHAHTYTHTNTLSNYWVHATI